MQKFSRKTIAGFVLLLAALLFAGGMYVVSALAPTTPTDLSGYGDDEQVTLEWTAAETHGEAVIVDYIIEYSVSGEDDWDTFTDDESDATTAVVTGLTNGTAYDFRVYAVNSDEEDNISDPSNSITVTPFTIPDAPTDVTAERGNEEVTVSFTPPVFDGGSEITQYKVIASPGDITETGVGSPIIIGGLSNGTAYTFTVVAINEAGESVESSPSNEVTPATVPDAPTDIVAVRGNGQATITFEAPISDGGSEITSYTVTSSPGDITEVGDGSPIVITGLTNGTPYTFTVTATNDVGASEPSEASDPVTPATTPDAPTGLTATPDAGEVALEWTAPAETGGIAITDYVIEYSVSNQDEWTTFADGTSTDTEATVIDLTNGTAYDFRVFAVNGAGQGPASVVATSTPRTVPDAPTIGAVTPDNGQVSVAFTAPASNGGSAITQYTVTSNPGGFTGTGSGSPIVVEGLTNGTSYTFTVTATNIAGTSEPSEASASVTPRTVPGAPTSVSAVRGNGQATVSFTAPASDGGSAITGYTVTSSPGGFTASGTSSPITVTGLTNGTSYTFTVVATNVAGDGPASSASSAVTPATTPGAPTGLTGTPSNGQVGLTWSAPASNGGSVITDYVIEWSESGENDWTIFADGTSTSTSAAVTSLSNGTAYDFRVSAVNAVGQGPASSTTTSTPRTVPGAPTGVSATPGNGQATVSFTAPASNGGSAITGYTVTSSPGGITGSGASSPIVVTGLENGTEYTFTVTATNAAGTGSASSASSAVTPRTVPGAPTGVSATPGNGQATVSFTAPASNGGATITQYTVTSSPGGFTGTGSGSPIVVTGLSNGTAYTFTVTATNVAGTGAASTASSSVTPRTVPGAPTSVSATPGNGQATVSFTPPASNGGADITSYTVTSSPGGFTASGAGSPIVVTGLENGTPYTFTVVATNEAGDSTASTASSSVTPRTVPGAPTDVSAVAGNTTATISFTPPESNGGSAITEYTVTSDPGGITATGSGSPIVVEGLSNGTPYTFTVVATNEAGDSTASTASSSVTPHTVPGAPTGVSATPGNGQATVTFTPPASNGGADITSYTVMSSPGDFTASGAGSPMVVTGLSNGTAYTFTVIATNAAGDSVASTASSSVTPRTVPGAPTGVTATPGNGSASVSFTPPASNGGATITSYTVTSSPGGFTASGATSPITVTGLTNGEEYTFTVVATNIAGDSASSNASAGVTPAAVPDEPTDLTASPGNGQVELSWTAPSGNGSEITDYVVEWSESGENDWTIFADGTSTATTVIVTGLTNGTEYDFRVSAVNAAGQGIASDLATTTPRTVPGAPTALTTTVGNTQIGLIWTAPVSNGGSVITDYVVEYSLSGEDDWTIFSDGTSTTPSALVTGLENDTAYDFRVSAVNAAGIGAASTIASATPILPTTVISEITAEPTDTTAVITWKTDIGASSRVEYGPSSSFGTLTPISDDSGERPTDHSVTLEDLNPCTSYMFRVISQPEDGGITTSTSDRFTTTGCAGEPEIIDEYIQTVSTAGGSAKLDNDASGVTSLTLTFPAGALEEDVVVQIKRLGALVEDVTGKPGSTLLVSNEQVYDIKAIAEDGTLVTDFSQPVTISIHYSTSDVLELDEPTMKLYNWHDGTWKMLSDCVVDADSNTITCTTTQFSLFALFGVTPGTETPPEDEEDDNTPTPKPDTDEDEDVVAVDSGDSQTDNDTTTDTTTDEETDGDPTPNITDNEEGANNEQAEQGSAVWWIVAAVAGVIILIIIIARSRRSREG